MRGHVSEALRDQLLDRSGLVGVELSAQVMDIIDSARDVRVDSESDAALAQQERGMIGLRTREGMAQRKAEGQHMGRSVAADFLPTYRRVLAMYADGESLNAIARMLNSEEVPTAKGGGG